MYIYMFYVLPSDALFKHIGTPTFLQSVQALFEQEQYIGRR